MAVVLAGIWTGHHLGGFSWQSNPNLEFNWHPLLMILGMIYLYGNGNNYFFYHQLFHRTWEMYDNLSYMPNFFYKFSKFQES